ncbi:MAG: cysteine desulfurase family protein [bacterium]
MNTLPKPKEKREVYLDHAATTYMNPLIIKEMMPYFTEKYGNPSSLYSKGRQNSQVLNDCRQIIANLIKARPLDIIFTGSGTESDNMAIYGVAQQHQHAGKHIISTPIEHHAVLHPLEDLKKQGWDITYLKVDNCGRVNPDELAKAIRTDTVLISIMHSNNEIGTIEPIAKIGREILKHKKKTNKIYPLFHTDACQSAGYLQLDVEKMHVDLMTINGSKLYGPKGVGMLYLRQGIKIKPLIKGGSQERGLRAGTENVASIVGFTKAFELAQENMEDSCAKVSKVRDYLWNELNDKIDNITLNGPSIDSTERLPNNLNVLFKGIEGEALLLYLDEYGVMCSTGSACTSDSLDPSHVLTAIGVPKESAHGSIRFTFGQCNKADDVDYLMEFLPQIVAKLREISTIR